MATRRDLVEAQTFNRRRLASAFVSGADANRGEPPRPGRALVGGLALCVLLLAGAAVLGLVKPRAPEGWLDEGTLIASDQEGTLYLVARANSAAQLRPFVNATSARLYLGADAEPVHVDQDEIDREAIGPTIGIQDAPTTLPGAGALVESGWLSCAGRKDLHTWIGDPPEHRDAAGTTGRQPARLVRAGGHTYLITAAAYGDTGSQVAQRFDFDGSRDRPLLRDLGIDPEASAVVVPIGWLQAFPEAAQPLSRSLIERNWASVKMTMLSGEPCARLEAASGQSPRVLLAAVDPEVMTQAVGQGLSSVSVAPGHGALVGSGDFGDSESSDVVLIDGSGRAFPVTGRSTLEKLGYGIEPPVVPTSWVDLFEPAAALDTAAAGQPLAGSEGAGAAGAAG